MKRAEEKANVGGTVAEMGLPLQIRKEPPNENQLIADGPSSKRRKIDAVFGVPIDIDTRFRSKQNKGIKERTGAVEEKKSVNKLCASMQYKRRVNQIREIQSAIYIPAVAAAAAAEPAAATVISKELMHNGQNAQTGETEEQKENNQERNDDKKFYDALRSRLSRARNVSCMLFVVCFLFNPLTHRTNVCRQKRFPSTCSSPT